MQRPIAALFALATSCLWAAALHAQECRRTCRVDETRDANGCCVAASSPTVSSAAPRPLPRRCPAGTNWSDNDHACLGHLECPAGSQPQEGHGCVADVVACPPGSRRDAGRCVLDVTCPPNTHLDGGACISEVSCPASTTLQAGRCVSSDVHCPEGTHARDEGGCVGEPICPAETHFVDGRGCVGEPQCAAGTHFVADRGCVGETVCSPGTRSVEGRGCVDVCLDSPHSRWDQDRGACVCQSGYSANGGQCQEVTNCPAGTHSDGAACVPEVICPYDYTFVTGRGCVDTRAENAARQYAENEAAARRRAAAIVAANRWTNGPAVQLFAGIGGIYLLSVNGFTTNLACQTGCNTSNVQWANVAYELGVDFSSQGFVLGVNYTHVDGSTTGSPTSWSITPHALDLFMLEVADQGVGPFHTWRFGLQGGYDFITGTGAYAALYYRSLFNLYRGIFIGFELRGMGTYRWGAFNVAHVAYNGASEPFVAYTDQGLGGGGSATIFVGYSIH